MGRLSWVAIVNKFLGNPQDAAGDDGCLQNPHESRCNMTKIHRLCVGGTDGVQEHRVGSHRAKTAVAEQLHRRFIGSFRCRLLDMPAIWNLREVSG